MATVIHNRGAEVVPESESWVGTLLVGIVLVILAILFFVYAVPALQNDAASGTTADEINVNLPDQLNLDLNEGAAGSNPAPSGQTNQ